MKKNFLLLTLAFCLLSFSQDKNSKSITVSKKDAVNTLDLLQTLNEKGLDMSKDSIIESEEFKRIINDKEYRNSIYPETYTWEHTIAYIKSKELKKAFWYLINIYPTSDKNKELVLKSVITYDQLVKMDEVMINTFYTYSFTDPTISEIKDGKPEIIRPDILEIKLNNVKEIVTYVKFYRNEKAKSSKKD